MQYWVTRRDSRNQEPRGDYRTIEVYAGPYLTHAIAAAEAERLRAELQRQLENETIDKALRRPLLTVTFWPMSDAEIEEGRRRGINMVMQPSAKQLAWPDSEEVPLSVQASMNKMIGQFADEIAVKLVGKVTPERAREIFREMLNRYAKQLAEGDQLEEAAAQALGYIRRLLWFTGEM